MTEQDQVVLISIGPLHQLAQTALVQADHQIARRLTVPVLQTYSPLEQRLIGLGHILTGDEFQLCLLPRLLKHPPVGGQLLLIGRIVGGIAPGSLVVVQIKAGIASALLGSAEQAAVHLGILGILLLQHLDKNPVPLDLAGRFGESLVGRVQNMGRSGKIACRLRLGRVGHPQAKDLQQHSRAQQQRYQRHRQKGHKQPPAEGMGHGSSHNSSSPPR